MLTAIDGGHLGRYCAILEPRPFNYKCLDLKNDQREMQRIPMCLEEPAIEFYESESESYD